MVLENCMLIHRQKYHDIDVRNAYFSSKWEKVLSGLSLGIVMPIGYRILYDTAPQYGIGFFVCSVYNLKPIQNEFRISWLRHEMVPRNFCNIHRWL